MKFQNLLCRMCLMLILMLTLINVQKVNAQSPAEAELGAISTLNVGTDRIIDMLNDEPKEKEDKPSKSEKKSSEVVPDTETFYPTGEPRPQRKHKKTEVKKEKTTKTEVITTINGGTTKLELDRDGEIKSKIVGADIGYIREVKTTSGNLKFGAVVDYNHNNFDVDSSNDDGKINTITAGVVAKQMKKDGFYYEGSIRAGKAKTELEAEDCKFDKSVGVYAGHLKLGKVMKVNDQSKIDVYGAYAFSHQKNTRIITKSNDVYNCGSMDSNRFKVGCRMSTKVNNGKIYYGAAYQYESSLGLEIHHEDEKFDEHSTGNSGLIELGYQLSNKNKTANLDLNATGFTGQQKGGIFKVQFTKLF